MVDLYKQPEQPLPKLDNFKSFDVNGQEVTNVIPENSELYNLPPDQQEAALAELQKPPTGEELAYALAQNPNFEKAMTIDEFIRYDDYMKTVETDWIEGIMTGAGMVVDEIGNGLSAMYNDDEKLKRAIPTLAEGFARGTRDMYGLVAQSADPQSPFFKFKELLTGSGSPEERFQQFKEARDFNRRSLEIMEGKANVTDIDPDLINPQVAQALSYVADPSWALPFIGQAGKAMGISAKSIGLAKLSEQIAVVGAMTESAKRMAFGGLLKVAGAPLNLLGDATMRTIEWGAERATGAFEFATGMAYQDARRIVRDAGLYGGTIFRVPYMSTISDSYIAGFGAKGLGEAMDIMGDVIMGRKRGVYSYAEEALAAGKDVLSPQAKAMLRILNQADPILSYGYAAVEGMTEGALVGAALGYGSARGEGAAQGIGMGAAMGAGGALMGRAWAGMAREGGIIHQRVLTELEFVKNAMKDVDPDKLAQINTLQELAALHGQDLSWQILGILKLAPDLKIEVLDSIGFEQQRRKNRGPMKEGEVDPLFGLDLDDPNDIKKVRQLHNYEGVVVQHEVGGQTTLYINADHYKKYTFGHEMFHGIMRTSVMGEEFIKDLREKLMGRVTENGVELPGVIEPAKMRSFMERYIKAAYSNNPEQRDARLRALDAAIKAYEADGTLIPGQDDARPVLDLLTEEAGAYYFSHMIEGRDMDWLYRGGDLGGIRQVIADAKEGIRDFIEAKFGSAGMDFKAASTLHEAFLKGGKEGGSRIRIGALDALMQDIIRRQAGSQEGRVIDFGDMTGDQQRRFRDRNGLGDVLQPRKNGGMDARKRTAAEESARAKQIVDALRAMNDTDRTSTTVVEKNGDVTIYGNLSDAELNQLVRVGAMLPTEASRYRMFRDVIANKGKGANVFGAVLVGESFEVGEGRNPRRLRRSRGDKVPTTNREFMPIEMRTEIRLTKGGKGKATFVVTGLDIKNADMRLRELWHREDVQKSWGGDYNAFAADFYMYLQNASDPNGIPSAEYFGGGQKGSYKRNVFHEAFGAAMKDGESPFNEPSPTYKGSAGRGEKFVIYSMTLGSMYDVKMRDRNVPYNHSIAYDRIRRNWSPSEMRQEVLPEGEKLTHEMSGYSFIKGPNGKWRAYDNFRRVVGIAEDATTATEIGRKAYNAEQARQAKEIRNMSVNEKTDITAKGWAPVFFSAVERFVKSGAITPNMHPEQVWARISKASFAGIRADELRFLGLKERILGKDNAHLQNAREMNNKVQELYTYSQRFASQDPAKLARVQEVAAKLRKAQQEEYKKGVEMQRKEQAADSLAIGKPIGQEGLDVINKHLQERAFGLRMTEEGTSFSSYVADGAREEDSYVILTARSNQHTGVNGHFGDDVIVHIRVDIRTDPNTGERVLVVHEIQANNAEDKAAAKSPEQIRIDIRQYEEALKDHENNLRSNKEVVQTKAHRIAGELSIDSAGYSGLVGHGVFGDIITTAAQSRYERQRIAVSLQNVRDMISNLGNGPLQIGTRASGPQYGVEVSLVFTPEVQEMMRKRFELYQTEIIDMLTEAHKYGAFPMFSAGDDRYAIKKLVFEILNSSPFLSAYNGVRQTYKLPDYHPLVTSLGEAMSETMGAEVAILGEVFRDVYIKMTHEQRKNLFKFNRQAQIVYDDVFGTMNTINSARKEALRTSEIELWATAMRGSFGLDRLSPFSLHNYTPYLEFDNKRQSNAPFTGDFIQKAVRHLILGSEGEYGALVDKNLQRTMIDRYDHITDMAGRDLLEASVEAINDKKFLNEGYQFMANDSRIHRLQKTLSENPTGKLSDSALGYVRNFALMHLSKQVADNGRAYFQNTLARDDVRSKIQKLESELGSKEAKLIAQTPQDWVIIGIKMAMRHAAEKGIRTIYLTDAMGGPTKCGMDYMSSTAHYDIAVPNLTRGFLRQYDLKLEMPVQQKRYNLYYDSATDETKALGTASGVSWQEQLGYKPRFYSSTFSGERKFSVKYTEPAGKMPFNEQDIQKAQMKNMARFTMTDEVMGSVLGDGFRNLSPSEGGEVPPMPRSEEGRRRDAAPRTLNMFPRDREFKRWAGKLPLVSLDGIRHMTAPDNKFDVDSREAYHMLKNGFVVTAFHGTPERSHESFENRVYHGTYFVPDEKAAAEYARIFAVDAQAKEVLSKGRDAAYADERTRKLYDTWPKEKGKPGLDAYTFGKPDMYYLRSENPIVALDIRTGVAENRKIKKVIDRLVRDALDNENPTRAEYRDKFEEIISRIEAADMYDINGGGYDSIQNTFVEYAFQEGFDSAVFFDTSIDSYAPTIVINNAKQSNVKAASNIGAFSEDARFDYSPSEKPKPQSRTIDEAMKLPGFAKFAKGTEVVGQEEFHYILDVFGDMKERVKVPTGVFNREPNQAIYDITRPVTLIAYHGSTSKRRFETLRTNVPESESYWAKKGSVDSALGTHYTNDETLSSNFTRRKMRKDGDGWDWSKKPVGQMYEVAVRMDKPLYFDGEGSLHAKIKQAGGAEAYKASLVEQGYDGIIYRVEGERQAQARKMDDSIPDFVDTAKGRDVFGYIPFNEGNVKDLQNNVGTFDRSDSRINYSPSEKPIEELGKESFVTGKNKFDKLNGKLFFRERGTGKYYVMVHAGWDASYAIFEPYDLFKESLDENTSPERQTEVNDLSFEQRITVRPPTGSGGLGFRGIEEQMRQRFDSYSKTEPGVKTGDDVKPDGPELDVAAIKTNGDAIKDALTSLDGLEFTKDETFRLFGRRSTRGRTLGLIDEINAEVDKAKSGEQPDVAKIEEKLSEIEEMRDDMQEKQENTPENFQDSEAYQNREENIDAMTEVIDEVRGLMEPPKGGEETRNMSVAENIGDGEVKFGGEYKGVTNLLSTLELWALAAKAGKLSREAKLNHKNVNAEAIKTIEWLLTNDNSGVTANRPNFTTEHEAMKWVKMTALSQYKGWGARYLPDSYKKSMKQAYLAADAVLGIKKKKKTPKEEPKAKDGASFDDWYDWARKKRVNGRNVATARNALKFITEMPGEGYFKAVAQMLLAMGNVPFLDMNLRKVDRGFMRATSQGGVGRIAISTSGGGKSDTGVSMAGRTDSFNDSTVSVVIEEVMHAAQLTNANFAPWNILRRNLGTRGVEWKKNALKLISEVEGEIKGMTYDSLTAETKHRLIAARIAKLILEGTKGITALSSDGKRGFDLHQALFTDLVKPGGVWRSQGDPSKGGGAGVKLRFEHKLKDGTGKAETGYHFGNVAEFLVGIFSDPHLAKFYFDKPPVDLSSLTPKGERLRTSWRNLASQMISVAIDFFTGLFKGEKKNLGSQFIEETVVLLQRQAENFGNKEPANQIDATISTNEVGFPEKPMKKPVGLRGKAPLPSEGPINMGLNDSETGLATVSGSRTRAAAEVGPATQVVDGEAKPIPRQGRPTPRIGMADKDVPAQRYYYPPPAKSVSMTPVWSTGDAMAGRSILTSTAGYMVMLINGKWRVYNPEKEIIGVFNDEQKAKDLADRRAMRK